MPPPKICPGYASMPSRPPRATILYHYFHPDDVVSARHFSDFGLELQRRGWKVEAFPGNRGCRDETRVYPRRELWNGIAIYRVWRPRLKQHTTLGRVLNACLMIAAWSLIAFRRRGKLPDVVVMGTDPIMSVLVAAVVRRIRPRISLVHWCFDLYPEAAIADGLLGEDALLVRGLRRMLRTAYASCDAVVDLGTCMRARLERYGSPAMQATLVPWALCEPPEVRPPDRDRRLKLFGDCRVGVLYSGNFGRAHSCRHMLALARRLRGTGVEFCFSVRGNRVDELRGAVQGDDENVHLADFAPEAELEQHLAAADIHLVSLRHEWTGTVTPSKFFGSLAAGRPVIFEGAKEGCIAQWIIEHRVGWVLGDDSLPAVAEELTRLADRPEALRELQTRCHQAYASHFSKRTTMDQWDRILRGTCKRAARTS
jgi:colanic acid biosynthesis glycosyl transferase WcaI